MIRRFGVRRRGSGLMMAAAAALPGGCVTVAGDWVADWGARTPSVGSVSAISFDQHGRYTATVSNDGDRSTTTGRYSWNGTTLTLTPDEGEVQTVVCRSDWDGSLLLQNLVPGDGAPIRLTAYPKNPLTLPFRLPPRSPSAPGTGERGKMGRRFWGRQ